MSSFIYFHFFSIHPVFPYPCIFIIISSLSNYFPLLCPVPSYCLISFLFLLIYLSPLSSFSFFQFSFFPSFHSLLFFFIFSIIPLPPPPLPPSLPLLVICSTPVLYLSNITGTNLTFYKFPLNQFPQSL